MGQLRKRVSKTTFFDLVTAVETCYFWPNLKDAFIEIKRVLKKGGYLLIISEMIKDGTYEVENAEVIAKNTGASCSFGGNAENFTFR